MTEPTAPAVTSILDLGAITHKPTRDALRQAAAGTRSGPVWVTRRDGKRVAAIVSVEDAQFLAAMRRQIHGTEG